MPLQYLQPQVMLVTMKKNFDFLSSAQAGSA